MSKCVVVTKNDTQGNRSILKDCLWVACSPVAVTTLTGRCPRGSARRGGAGARCNFFLIQQGRRDPAVGPTIAMRLPPLPRRALGAAAGALALTSFAPDAEAGQRNFPRCWPTACAQPPACPTVLLNTGAQIPQLGFGTYLTNGDDLINSLIHAIRVGYRHIDTAAGYLNEPAVAEAIYAAGVPRSELFLASKLWCSDHGRRRTEKAIQRSLQNLGTDYLDRAYTGFEPAPLTSHARPLPRTLAAPLVLPLQTAKARARIPRSQCTSFMLPITKGRRRRRCAGCASKAGKCSRRRIGEGCFVPLA